LPKSTLRIDQSAAYSPSYLYQLFPGEDLSLGEAIPANPEYQILATDSYSYRTQAALSFGSARGTQVTTSGGFNRTDFQEETRSRFDLEVVEAGVRVSRRLAPSRALSGGYKYRSGEFGLGGPTTEHQLSIGIDYSPALSRTRRATFALEVSPTRVSIPASTLRIDTDQVKAQVLRMSAQANVSYPFKLNWRAAARYRRSVEYLSVLGQPVMSDGARLEVAGLLARPLDLTISAAYATAASVLALGSRDLQTYTGQANIRYALKRSFALYSEYVYYYYDLRGQAGFSPALPGLYEQHGVRVGAAVFLEPLGR
jgi:hypothetical protein